MTRIAAARGPTRLRYLSAAVPLAGLAALYLLRLGLLHIWPVAGADAMIGLLVFVGVLIFSWSIFRVIGRQQAELVGRYETERRLRAQLEAVHQASLTIVSTQTAAEILQRLVELARELIPARYAALGVLGPQGAIDAFYTAGFTEEERAWLGPPPQGHGLLGVTLTEGRSVRVSDISQDPRRAGFPPSHPKMQTLLAVPVAHAGLIVGYLYLTDRIGTDAFSAEDERLLSLLAGHAAVVIEQARLAEQVRRLAIVAERDRIRKDLQDTAIQALYAVSLELETVADEVDHNSIPARERIDHSIDHIGEVMIDIRQCILGLEPTTAANEREKVHV